MTGCTLAPDYNRLSAILAAYVRHVLDYGRRVTDFGGFAGFAQVLDRPCEIEQSVRDSGQLAAGVCQAGHVLLLPIEIAGSRIVAGRLFEALLEPFHVTQPLQSIGQPQRPAASAVQLD